MSDLPPLPDEQTYADLLRAPVDNARGALRSVLADATLQTLAVLGSAATETQRLPPDEEADPSGNLRAAAALELCSSGAKLLASYNKALSEVITPDDPALDSIRGARPDALPHLIRDMFGQLQGLLGGVAADPPVSDPELDDLLAPQNAPPLLIRPAAEGVNYYIPVKPKPDTHSIWIGPPDGVWAMGDSGLSHFLPQALDLPAAAALLSWAHEQQGLDLDPLIRGMASSMHGLERAASIHGVRLTVDGGHVVFNAWKDKGLMLLSDLHSVFDTVRRRAADELSDAATPPGGAE